MLDTAANVSVNVFIPKRDRALLCNNAFKPVLSMAIAIRLVVKTCRPAMSHFCNFCDDVV